MPRMAPRCRPWCAASGLLLPEYWPCLGLFRSLEVVVEGADFGPCLSNGRPQLLLGDVERAQPNRYGGCILDIEHFRWDGGSIVNAREAVTS